MVQYTVQGGQKLSGSISIGGNKNSVLPCLAACLLTKDPVTLTNIPDISDIHVMLEIFEQIGVSYEWINKSTLKIQANDLQDSVLPKDLGSKLRASILLVGPLLARTGEARFSHPGGDIIGKRTLSTHFIGFEALGFEFEKHDLDYRGFRASTPSGTVSIFQEEASVTGTENVLMAAALGQCKFTLKNCPEEPHIVDLCNLLSQMGAQIQGIGTSTITVTGVDTLHGTEFRIGQDFMELGTYAIAAAITKGQITLTNCNLEGMEPVVLHLEKMGVTFIDNDDNSVTVTGKNLKGTSKLHTNIWPGFPSDLMSPAIVLATQAEGVSLLHDWMYESRMFFVDKLINMGAHITIADPHRVIVYGPTKLYGRTLESPDIRAGMALVLAALIAEGKSTINRAELIERGYENVVEKLTTLGAQIERNENHSRATDPR
jgi:UDP-N-acetylglucosamine 1-carboxyvinyltransferase